MHGCGFMTIFRFCHLLSTLAVLGQSTFCMVYSACVCVCVCVCVSVVTYLDIDSGFDRSWMDARLERLVIGDYNGSDR